MWVTKEDAGAFLIVKREVGDIRLQEIEVVE
jgi:hypothetical protein